MSMRVRKRLPAAFAVFAVLAIALAVRVLASNGEDFESGMYATAWSIVPPLVAIALALITKEVYISLFAGILCGALFYANFSPVLTVTTIVDSFIENVGDGWNVGILIFLVLLGILVVLMNRAGGSAAYGNWAAKRIKTKVGAQLSTVALGIFIFIDDYFNCLTVGSVMSPVTDKHKISRAKLAYIIDATAAPVCIIAPISSWAAAVTSSTSGDDGFTMFLRTIPYNLYALLSIVMLIFITLIKFDFGQMKKQEQLAAQGKLFGEGGNEYAGKGNDVIGTKGKVLDLVIPVIVLIVSCIIGMLYTGDFFGGTPFIDAFANCDPSVGLVLGALVTLIIVFLLYVPRRVLTFKQFAEALPEGFRQMVPAILILSFAWTLSSICRGGLGIGVFVAGLVEGSSAASALMPAIMFAVALGLAFATGTSWGTFAILIPIAAAVFPASSESLVISIAACLAGAVCGDHISPISDTTIMSSTGAQCNHILHVSTQIPYALIVAGVSFVGYLLSGFVQSAPVVFAVSLILLIGVLLLMRHLTNKSKIKV